ncbi:MAG: RNA polymerase sigma factor [Chitinophagales bacterium]
MARNVDKDEIYLEGIKRGNRKVIHLVYQKFYKAIAHLVETHGGSEEDARDVFQEGLMVMYQKSQSVDFQLKSSFLTYFYTVCRNIWSNKLRKKPKKQVTFDTQLLSIEVEDPNINIEKNQQYFLYRKKFLELGKDCQKILGLFLKKVKMEEITKQMGYSSINYTKKRKFLCKEKLVQLIQKDRSFEDLKK